MSWDAASRGPILNARERWRAQEHTRRIRLLGEWLAEDWESVVDEFADAQGKVHKEKVLQLMEDVWKMAGGPNEATGGQPSNAADQGPGKAPADRREPEAQVRPPHHALDPGAADSIR